MPSFRHFMLTFAMLAAATPHGSSDEVPADVAKRIKQFEREAAAIRQKAQQEIDNRQQKMLEELQRIQEEYQKAGKVKEAAAIRARVKEIQVEARIQLIRRTIDYADQSTRRIKSLSGVIHAAMEKMAQAKELDLRSACEMCDELRQFCTDEVLVHSKLMRSLPKVDLGDAQEKLAPEINKTLAALQTETLKLEQLMTRLAASVNDQVFADDAKREAAIEAVETLKRKIVAAQAEFEKLNR